jgi:hypothetical protein
MSRPRCRVLLAAGVSSLLTSVAIAGTTAATSTTEPESGAVEILPPEESFAGATLGEWGARYLEWALGLSEDFRCEDEQYGPVFFLPLRRAAAATSIDCLVPEGKAMYVPLYANFCGSNLPPPNFGRNEEELQACLAALPPLPQTESAVNGQEVDDLDAYTATTPMFNYNHPPDNPYGNMPGVSSQMFVNSAYIIAPSPPGQYVITVTDNFGGLLYDTINVTVEPPQVIEPTETAEAQATDALDATEPPSTN